VINDFADILSADKGRIIMKVVKIHLGEVFSFRSAINSSTNEVGRFLFFLEILCLADVAETIPTFTAPTKG
jgi:hypothetical protein